MAKNLLIPNERLSLATSGIVTADGSAAVVGAAMKYTVPDGDVIALPKFIRPTMKLLDAASTEMPRDTVWGFGLITTMDPYRIVPIGPQMMPYANWLDLTLAQQGDKDYAERLTRDITREAPVIIINQDETLCFLVYSATGTLDVSECTIEFDIYKGRALASSAKEFAWRFNEIAR